MIRFGRINPHGNASGCANTLFPVPGLVLGHSHPPPSGSVVTASRGYRPTGGASGIGLALGTALVLRGWHVVLADIQDVAAKEHADRLTLLGPGSAVGVHVDVRDADAVAGLVESTQAEHGRLDLMVNNAGIGLGGEPEELELVHWNHIIDVNLRGVIHGCQAAYPLMMRQGHGQILNVASSAGLIPSPGQMAPYAATKFAVVGLSHALRAAGTDRGIRVNVLCPGWIDTPLLDGAWPEDLPIPPSVAASPTMREGLVKLGVRIYPADRLAEDTLRGLERDKPVLVIPSEWHRNWLLFRFVPGLVEGKALAMTRAMREAVGQRSPSQGANQPA